MFSLSASRVLKLPQRQAFIYATDFTRYQALARKRGVVLESLSPGAVTLGHKWRITRVKSGEETRTEVEIVDFQPTSAIAYGATVRRNDVTVALELTEEAAERCRMTVDIEVVPNGLRGRMTLAPLLLAKARATKALEKGLQRLARDWEADYLKGLGD